MFVVNNRYLNIAGADGCRGGWVIVRRTGDGPVSAAIVPDARRLIGAAGGGILLVDVPIGLADSGARRADKLARGFLGWPRRCSVFSAPIRPVLRAGNYTEASQIRRAVEGKGMSRQAWGITAKIREVDEAIRELDPAQARVHEGHPEVSFAEWAGQPMHHAKKRPSGREEREQVIESHFPEGCVSHLWSEIRGHGVARDDLIDALAMLWSAERLAAGRSKVMPGEPERDACGLRMEIVY